MPTCNLHRHAISPLVGLLAMAPTAVFAQSACEKWDPEKKTKEAYPEYVSSYGTAVFRVSSDRLDRNDDYESPVKGTATLFYRDEGATGKPQYGYFLTAKHAISDNARTLEEAGKLVRKLQLQRLADDQSRDGGWIYLDAEVIGWPGDSASLDIAVLRADMSKVYALNPNKDEPALLLGPLGNTGKPVTISLQYPKPTETGVFLGYTIDDSARGLSGGSFTGVAIESEDGIAKISNAAVQDAQSGALFYSNGSGWGILRSYGPSPNEATTQADDQGAAVLQRITSYITTIAEAKPFIQQIPLRPNLRSAIVLDALATTEESLIERKWRFSYVNHAVCLEPIEALQMYKDFVSNRGRYKTLYTTSKGQNVFFEFVKFLSSRQLGNEARELFKEAMNRQSRPSESEGEFEAAMAISADLSHRAALASNFYGGNAKANKEVANAEEFYIDALSTFAAMTPAENDGVAHREAGEAHRQFANLKYSQFRMSGDLLAADLAASAIRDSLAFDSTRPETVRLAQAIFRDANEPGLARQAIRSEFALTQDPTLQAEWSELIGERGQILPWIEIEKATMRLVGFENAKQITPQRIERKYDRELFDLRAVALGPEKDQLRSMVGTAARF